MEDVQLLNLTEDKVEEELVKEELIEEELVLEIEKEGDVAREVKACANYRIDPTKEFGLCKCGWAKKDHLEKEENKAAVALRNLKAKSKKYSSVEVDSKGDGPCAVFRLDTTAAEFGTCKCGYKQKDHKAKVENKASLALKSLKSKNASRNSRIQGDSPCSNYRVDVNALNFGDCLCGFPKDAHKEETENAGARALRLLKEKNAAKNAKADAIADGTWVEEEEEADAEAEAEAAALEAAAAYQEQPEPVENAPPVIVTSEAKSSGGCCTVS